jgi:hypothetical protein
MAVARFEEKTDECANAYVFTDNSSAIQAVDSPQPQSGQYIIKGILDTIDRIHEAKSTCTIHVEWVPGHKNVDGNERAKTAATSFTTAPTTRMKSAQNRSTQSTAKTEWETECQTGRENARRLRNMSQHPDTNAGPTLYGALQQGWKHVLLITRPRTGHCHLNEYLYLFNKIETPECECGPGKETVNHFPLNCELYDEERDKLRRRIGVQGMRSSVLLGDNKIIKNAVEYIETTGRFKLEGR